MGFPLRQVFIQVHAARSVPCKGTILISRSFALLGWLYHFFRRLILAAPLQAPSGVVVSLCSQLLQIIAFLLPLKVMILLGTPDVPEYFPRMFADIARDKLILLLAVAALLLYAAHLLMEFLGVWLVRQGSLRLISNMKEGEALAKQLKVAQIFFRGLLTISCGLLFALGVMIFLGLFHVLLLLVVLAYVLSSFFVLALVYPRLPEQPGGTSPQFVRIVDMVSACGFLLVFGFLVMDFLYGTAEGLLLGILALLLCRHMFSRLAMALKGIERLYGHRENLRILSGELPVLAMDEDDEIIEESVDGRVLGNSTDEVVEKEGQLAPGHETPGILDGDVHDVLMPEERNVQARLTFWQVLEKDYCNVWLMETLAAAEEAMDVIDIADRSEEYRGQQMLRVLCAKPASDAACFLFCMFNRKQTKQVAHAARLLQMYRGPSAPKLLHVSERQGFGAHLYEWPEDAHLVSDHSSILACREQVFIEASAWQVPQTLACSQPSKTLIDRCDDTLWARCRAFSNWMDHDTRRLIETFSCDPHRLRDALRCLPLKVYNPDIDEGCVYFTGTRYKVTRWSRWTLEPLGSGWPLELGLERLDQAFARAAKDCELLTSLSVQHVRLAALTFAFEALCEQGAYRRAFPLLGLIRGILDAMDSSA